MKKDFTKHKLQSKRTSAMTHMGHARWKGILALTIVTLLFCGGGFFAYQFKKNPQNFASIQIYVTDMTTWFEKHRNHIQQSIVKVKQLASNKNDTPPQIHFEFYTALPNMQMPATEPVLTPNKPEKLAQTTPTKVEDGLAQEISAQIEEQSYAIQLGVFKNEASAERYKKSLFANGYEALIVKLGSNDKRTYRVELGPFASKKEAKLAQLELQKKGFNGVLHSVQTI